MRPAESNPCAWIRPGLTTWIATGRYLARLVLEEILSNIGQPCPTRPICGVVGSTRGYHPVTSSKCAAVNEPISGGMKVSHIVVDASRVIVVLISVTRYRATSASTPWSPSTPGPARRPHITCGTRYTLRPTCTSGSGGAFSSGTPGTSGAPCSPHRAWSTRSTSRTYYARSTRGSWITCNTRWPGCAYRPLRTRCTGRAGSAGGTLSTRNTRSTGTACSSCGSSNTWCTTRSLRSCSTNWANRSRRTRAPATEPRKCPDAKRHLGADANPMEFIA